MSENVSLGKVRPVDDLLLSPLNGPVDFLLVGNLQDINDEGLGRVILLNVKSTKLGSCLEIPIACHFYCMDVIFHLTVVA